MKYILIIAVFSALSLFGCKDNTTDTSDPTDPEEYTKANGIKGGMLFDKFWATETGFDQANVNLAKFNANADFFRCKQCHAWDLMGRNGSYNNRAPKANRPNVADRNLRTTAKNLKPQELFNAIKSGLGKARKDLNADLSTYNPTTNNTIGDQMPDFSKILTDNQIWDIVKFLKVEALDITQLYDATYTGTYPTGSTIFANVGKDGDATAGNAFYTSNCVICHGTDGKQIPNLDATPGMTVGKFTRTKANELQHKIKFGQLGTVMKPINGTIIDFKNLYKALADTVKFPN